MPIADHVGSWVYAALIGGYNKTLILNGACANERLPVGPSGLLGIDSVEFREAQVITDRKSARPM